MEYKFSDRYICKILLNLGEHQLNGTLSNSCFRKETDLHFLEVNSLYFALAFWEISIEKKESNFPNLPRSKTISNQMI